MVLFDVYRKKGHAFKSLQCHKDAKKKKEIIFLCLWKWMQCADADTLTLPE